MLFRSLVVLWRAGAWGRRGERRADEGASAGRATIWLLRGAVALAAALVAVVPVTQAVSAARDALASDGAVLAHQRAVAAEIATTDAEWIATQWGGAVSLVVLAGAHVALIDAPPENIEGYPVLSTDPAACERPLVSAPPFVVCAR